MDKVDVTVASVSWLVEPGNYIGVKVPGRTSDSDFRR